MSMVRRRSRDPRDVSEATDMEPATHGPKSNSKTTTSIIIFALTTTLLFALYLASHFAPDLVPSSLLLGNNGSLQDEKVNERFRLHPEKHVYREASTSEHHWRVTSDLRRPDGVLKQVYLVNGLLPGPTLEVRSGDRLVIHVENALANGQNVSIHWHGLSMRGFNNMDGAAGITQDPIQSGETFVYDFEIDSTQHGTFWWHAHDGVQRADGLYGGLVVHEPAPVSKDATLEDEHLLVIGDWYHRSAKEALAFYMHPGAFGLETVPDSVLVNGRGAYACTQAVPARPVDCIQNDMASFTALKLDANQRTILRIINVGAYAGFSISLVGARLTPLRVDGGHAVRGSAARTVGFLHPGERVDVLIEPDSTEETNVLSLTVTLDDQPFKYQNPALTLSHEYSVAWHGDRTGLKAAQSSAYEFSDVQELESVATQLSLPQQADHTIVLYTLTQKLAQLENEPHGFINHTMWVPQSPALISQERDQWNKHQFIPHIKHDEKSPLWVDIVLNNLDEDWHPFHLHGYDFWLLSKYISEYNWGSYNPFEDQDPPAGEYNLINPIRKDTIYVPRRGYAVLRFRADHPGLWMFHCHVLWHQASGMAMAFDVR